MTKHELVEYMKNDCVFQHFAHLSCQKSSLSGYVYFFDGFYESLRFLVDEETIDIVMNSE